MSTITERIEQMSELSNQQSEEVSGAPTSPSNDVPARPQRAASSRKRPNKQKQTNQKSTGNIIAQTTAHIAQALGERQADVHILIHRIVSGLGVGLALDFLHQTQDIEAAGGRYTEEGVRRTPGGVFFRLIKEAKPLGHSATTSLFWPHPIQAEGEPIPPPKQKRLVPLTWRKRLAVIQQLAELREKGATGVTAAVILKLIGRTEQIVELDTCTVLSITSTLRPHVTKGIPEPQEAPTIYTVYLSKRLWGFAKEAAHDAEDLLIIEGFPQLDAETGTIALWAKTVTSKKRDQARRRGRQPAPETSPEPSA